MPPDSSCEYLSAQLGEADQRELLVDDPRALGLRHAAELEAEADILAHGPPGQQRELLEHHGDRAACGARGACAASQRVTSIGAPSCSTRTVPRATSLSRLTARSTVDLPEPERPISTQISPRSTARLMSTAPGTAVGLGDDLVAGRALVDHGEGRLAVGAEDDVDIA